MVFGELLGADGNSDDKGTGRQSVDRQPAVAGQFYPATEEALRSKLKGLFSKAIPLKLKNVGALIVPHAGYDYSGLVAASGFNQLDAEKTYEHIFVLAPSHRTSIRGAAVYCRGDYLSPLGVVHVEKDFAKSLLQKSNYIIEDDASHKYEHSLEVELPFLQFLMKRDFKMVPLVVGTQDPKVCSKLAEVLRPYFNPRNLFIISSDFSHYPSYEDAKLVDMLTLQAIEKNDPEELSKVIIENERLGIPGLATCICGLGPVLTLLYITRDQADVVITPLIYKNSGDASFGDKNNVVGYHAIAFSLEIKEVDYYSQLSLSKSEKKVLLKLARSTIDHYIKHRSIPETDHTTLTENLKKYYGAFVSLHKKAELRGCIGRFTEEEPLHSIVQRMAVSAATEDSRFLPVTEEEMPDIEIEISVLSPLKRINSIEEIELGKHGIYLTKGRNTGTFLPQVATEYGWTREEFLGHCAHNKAGIGWDGWRDAEIYIFESYVFSE